VARLSAAADPVPIVLLCPGGPEAPIEALIRATGALDVLPKTDLAPGVVRRSLQLCCRVVDGERKRDALRRQLGRQRRRLARQKQTIARRTDSAYRVADRWSHDFRTPLTVIREYLSLLRDGVVGPVSAEQQRMLEVAIDRADDLNLLLEEVLIANKHQAGILTARRQPCRLEEVVQQLEPALLRKAVLRKASLEIAVDQDLPECFCDPEQVGQVLASLVQWSLQTCGPAGRLRLDVTRGAEGRCVHLRLNGALQTVMRDSQRRSGGAADRGRLVEPLARDLSSARTIIQLNLGNLAIGQPDSESLELCVTLPASEPVEIVGRYLDWIRHASGKDPAVSLVVVTVGDDTPQRVADRVDALLSYELGPGDLLLRVAPRSWLAGLPGHRRRGAQWSSRAGRTLAEINQKRPHAPLPALSCQLLGRWDSGRDAARILHAVQDLPGVRDVSGYRDVSQAFPGAHAGSPAVVPDNAQKYEV